MALETVVFPNDHFLCTMKEDMEVGAWDYNQEFDAALQLQCVDIEDHALMQGLNYLNTCSYNTMSQNFDHDYDQVNSTSQNTVKFEAVCAPKKAVDDRRKRRRRAKKSKNKDEVENQRMTHIAVERNRRKQMNEYLAELRSLMPTSYVPRGDQASIIGGAINYVKELEQLIQSLEAHKRMKQTSNNAALFADFFTLSAGSSLQCTNNEENYGMITNNDDHHMINNKSLIANIEVTMIESHANLKLLTRKQHKQLLKLVAGLHNIWLTTLHLNVTTIDDMVLYSFSLKVEDECQLTSVDEIASAVQQIIGKINED